MLAEDPYGSATLSEFNRAYESTLDSHGGPKEMRPHDVGLWERDVRALIRSGALRADARILDFGSGSGHWSMFLAQLLPEAEIIGLDFADKAVADATRRAKEQGITTVRFVHYDGKTLPDFGRPFDCVICFGVLLCLEKDRVFEPLFRQLSAVLAGGGLLCIIELFHGPSREGATFKTFERSALLQFIRDHGFRLRSERIIYFSKLARYWIEATREAWPLRRLRPLFSAFLPLDRAVDALVLRLLRLPIGERRFLVFEKNKIGERQV